MNEQFMQILEAIGPTAMLVIIQVLSQLDEQQLQELIQQLQQAAQEEQAGAQQQQGPPEQGMAPQEQANANMFGEY